MRRGGEGVGVLGIEPLPGRPTSADDSIVHEWQFSRTLLPIAFARNSPLETEKRTAERRFMRRFKTAQRAEKCLRLGGCQLTAA
jgi:hypothetical protein